jgi:hypothetical protein
MNGWRRAAVKKRLLPENKFCFLSERQLIFWTVCVVLAGVCFSLDGKIFAVFYFWQGWWPGRAPTWPPFVLSFAFSAWPVWIVCRCLLNGSLAAMDQLQFYRVLCISLAAISGAEQPCAWYMFIVLGPMMDCRFGKSSESWAPGAIFLWFLLFLTRRTPNFHSKRKKQIYQFLLHPNVCPFTWGGCKTGPLLNFNSKNDSLFKTL